MSQESLLELPPSSRPSRGDGSNKKSVKVKSPSRAKANSLPCFLEGDGWRFYAHGSEQMDECADGSIALTVTSPPYWNAIDYDAHAREGDSVWYREREYSSFGESYEGWLDKIGEVFSEVLRTTMDGGFCAVVIGTILHKGQHYPAPFDLTSRLVRSGWNFHQDIVWNKVTGGVKRAGSFIQRPQAGYYYPNIMTEYIMIFRKGEVSRRDTRPALPIDDVFTRDIANTVWHVAPVPPRTIDHPCPYPDEIVRRLVRLYSQEGDEVLDPFLGSGQTARVALQNGRKTVGYDIEPFYIKMSSERLTEPTTRKFHLIPQFKKIPVANG